MKKLVALVICCSLMGCAALRAWGPAVIHVAGEDCVELTTGDLQTICATIDELMPFVEQILAKRIESAKKKALE